MTSKDRLPSPISRRILLASGANMIIGTGVISGCSSLLPAPAVLPVYVLEPVYSPAPAASRVNWQLVVGLPRAQAGLDTIRIALRKAPPLLEYYADAAWPDRLPTLIQDLLINCFVRSGRLLGVGREDSGIIANYRLDTELLNFESHYDPGNAVPEVLVQLDASLVSLQTRTIIARTAVTERVAVMRNDLSDIVTSFGAAAGMALDQLVAWTFHELPG